MLSPLKPGPLCSKDAGLSTCSLDGQVPGGTQEPWDRCPPAQFFWALCDLLLQSKALAVCGGQVGYEEETPVSSFLPQQVPLSSCLHDGPR